MSEKPNSEGGERYMGESGMTTDKGEEIVGIMKPALIFTTTRVLLPTAVSTAWYTLIAVVAFVSSWLFGIIIGLVITVVLFVAFWATKLRNPKDFSKVSLESILEMKPKEIRFSQIEKVEIKKGAVKFFYTDLGGKIKLKKEKQYVVENGKRHEDNVSLAHKVLQDKVVLK